MDNKERLRQLQKKARQRGEDLRSLVEHVEKQWEWQKEQLRNLVEYVEKQQEWQKEQLERWAEEMSNLLTFLLNFEQYLEMGDGLDGEGHGPADSGGGG